MAYCTLDQVQKLLPKNVVIGTNLLEENVNILESQVSLWMEDSAGLIDSYLSDFYRTPLVKFKKPDFSARPVISSFIEEYPAPIPLINARLTAAQVYDNIVMSQQEPNVSEWGHNMRSLAFDDIRQIQAGAIRLRGQVLIGRIFARQELLDPARLPSKGEISTNNRTAGK